MLSRQFRRALVSTPIFSNVSTRSPKTQSELLELLPKRSQLALLVAEELLTQAGTTKDSSPQTVLMEALSTTTPLSEVPTVLSQSKPRETHQSSLTLTTSLRMITGSGEWELLTTFTRSEADFIDQTTAGLDLSLATVVSRSLWPLRLSSGKSTSLPALAHCLPELEIRELSLPSTKLISLIKYSLTRNLVSSSRQRPTTLLTTIKSSTLETRTLCSPSTRPTWLSSSTPTPTALLVCTKLATSSQEPWWP